MIYIGIDAGKNTGFAVWDSKRKKFIEITSMPIHRAMLEVKQIFDKEVDNLYIRVEDARQRTWFGNKMSYHEERSKLQGVGSVKRDCTIWEDFLTDLGFRFEMVAPKRNVTKMTHEQFERLTGYGKRTNEHSRDAAMLVFGF